MCRRRTGGALNEKPFIYLPGDWGRKLYIRYCQTYSLDVYTKLKWRQLSVTTRASLHSIHPAISAPFPLTHDAWNLKLFVSRWKSKSISVDWNVFAASRACRHTHKQPHLTFSSIGYKLPSCQKLILQYLHRYGDSRSRAVLSRHKSVLKNFWNNTKKPKKMRNFSINLPHLQASWELSGEVSHCLFNSFEWKITYFLSPSQIAQIFSGFALHWVEWECHVSILLRRLSYFPSALLHNRNLCWWQNPLRKSQIDGWQTFRQPHVKHWQLHHIAQQNIKTFLVTWKLLSS